MNRLTLLRLKMQALLLAALTLLTGCFSTAHNMPAHYSLFFQAHPQINQSAPLRVSVLLLKSDADFMSADFYSLQTNAAGVLGSSLLNVEQFFLRPGQLNQNIIGQSSAEARYIGILAEYQHPDGKTWRLSLPLSPPRERHFYTLWQGSSDEVRAEIIADISGVRALR
ncbi:type VI secretion system lipoprotein TssJ [Pantoea sp. B65]|uniref:type VI secretion system lipoprotein TssJ n=1 Tax=Pantoea sp. B65 TaxID=2813359 RepID=UPI0039B5436F